MVRFTPLQICRNRHAHVQKWNHVYQLQAGHLQNCLLPKRKTPTVSKTAKTPIAITWSKINQIDPLELEVNYFTKCYFLLWTESQGFGIWDLGKQLAPETDPACAGMATFDGLNCCGTSSHLLHLTPAMISPARPRVKGFMARFNRPRQSLQ